MNKYLLVIALLASGVTASAATLKEKLAMHSQKIQAMKQKARSGASVHAQERCGVDCQRCSSGSGSGSGSGGGSENCQSTK
jgi:hypothetical protein